MDLSVRLAPCDKTRWSVVAPADIGFEECEVAVSQSWQARLQGLEVYFKPRVFIILFLGFSSGLPLLLVLSTLSARLADSGVDLSTIGLFGYVFLPFVVKFLWAPIIDKLPLPVLTTTFGQRRGWLLFLQPCLMIAIFGLGQADPAIDPFRTAMMAMIVSFFAASQDIVIDALRIEILDKHELGAGTANHVVGYRIGMWVAGAGALILADRQGWPSAYAVMAALIIVGVITVLFLNEPKKRAEIDEGDQPEVQYQSLALLISVGIALLTFFWIQDRYGVRDGVIGGMAVALFSMALWFFFGQSSAFRQATIDPYRDFFVRNGVTVAVIILTFVSFFKASDVLLTQIANPFYLDVGFSLKEIGKVSGTFGFFITFVGSYVAGLLIYRIGIMACLWISGILMMLSNLMFALQAHVGADIALFYVTIFVENASGGMGTTAFVAYLASLCNQRYTALQYALLSSFMQVLGKLVFVPSSGFLAESDFFIMSSLAGLPALLLLWWLGRKVQIADPPQPMAAAGSSA